MMKGVKTFMRDLWRLLMLKNVRDKSVLSRKISNVKNDSSYKKGAHSVLSVKLH